MNSNLKLIRKIVVSNISLLLLGGLTVWLGVSVGKEAYRKHQVREEIARLKAEIVQMEQENDNLVSLIHSFEDRETVELEAKKRLNLQKPGEEVAVILRSKNDESQNIAQDDTGASDEIIERENGNAREEVANPVKWWKYITSSE